MVVAQQEATPGRRLRFPDKPAMLRVAGGVRRAAARSHGVRMAKCGLLGVLAISMIWCHGPGDLVS